MWKGLDWSFITDVWSSVFGFLGELIFGDITDLYDSIIPNVFTGWLDSNYALLAKSFMNFIIPLDVVTHVIKAQFTIYAVHFVYVIILRIKKWIPTWGD